MATIRDNLSRRKGTMMKAELSYKKKAKENFALAKTAAKSHPNAAASRVYYALFQAAVSEFERLNIDPQKIDRGAADAFQDRGVKWTHSFVKSNSKLIGLDGRQVAVLKKAYLLRTDADYDTLDVLAADVLDILSAAEDVLKCLGIVS